MAQRLGQTGNNATTREFIPSEPPLLPEDELDLARRYMVGTLEDASTVLDLPRAKLLQLSASQNVLDMRYLMERTLLGFPRLVQLAQRKVEEQEHEAGPSARDTDPLVTSPSIGFVPPVRPKFSHQFTEDGWSVTHRAATMHECLKLLLDSFWPSAHMFPGVRGSPLNEWMALGAPARTEIDIDNPEDIPRIYNDCCAATHEVQLSNDGTAILNSATIERATVALMPFQNALSWHTTYRFGHILELRDERGDIAALMMAIPPGVNTSIGYYPYYYGMAKNVTLGKFPKVAPQHQARDVLIGAILDDMRPKNPHWYVQVLATSPIHRRKGAAKRLLDLLASWAERDNVFCYLETDGWTASNFYETKGGYRRIWDERVHADESDSTGLQLVGLTRV